MAMYLHMHNSTPANRSADPSIYKDIYTYYLNLHAKANILTNPFIYVTCMWAQQGVGGKVFEPNQNPT